jgi:hypothetical protein
LLIVTPLDRLEFRLTLQPDSPQPAIGVPNTSAVRLNRWLGQIGQQVGEAKMIFKVIMMGELPSNALSPTRYWIISTAFHWLQ